MTLQAKLAEALNATRKVALRLQRRLVPLRLISNPSPRLLQKLKEACVPIIAASASFVALLLGATFCAFAASPFENMFVTNEDDSHFFGSRRPDQMTLEGLNAFVDQYVDTAVTHLFLCPNSSRANFTNQARDAIWEPNCAGKESTELWSQNCKLLEERGLDPYKIWIARC